MPWIEGADGVRIHYVVWGNPDGEPVLLVHGLGTDHLGWIRQRRAFGRRYRCYSIDNRGSGRSDKPTGAYRLEDMVHDALAVLDDCGVDSAHVVGASMGGVLAQLLVVAAPERVRSLTLACTACSIKPWREELLGGWIELVKDGGLRGFATNNLDWIFGSRSLRRLYPLSVLIGPYLMRSTDDGFIGQVEGMISVDEGMSEHLRHVNVPTLVVTGSQDILTPIADAEEIASLIPTSRLVVVRGAAHGFMLEDAKPFNKVVLEFIDQVRSDELASALAPTVAADNVIPLRRRAS